MSFLAKNNELSSRRSRTHKSHPVAAQLAAASRVAVEQMESRVLLSTTIAGWSFSAAAAAPIANPVNNSASFVTLTNNQTSGSAAPILKAIGMGAADGEIDNEDVASTSGTAHATFTENTWRLRGAVATFT